MCTCIMQEPHKAVGYFYDTVEEIRDISKWTVITT